MRRIIGILSGKGGVGKTTLSVNLALAMHKLGEDVIAVDGNLKNPNFALHLGSFEYNNTLHDVLDKKLSMLEALHIHKTGLRYIPSHLSLQYLNTPSARLKNVFEESNSTVLLDSPPGLSTDVISIMEACDEIIIITHPYLPDLTDCLKTIEVARDMGVIIKGIVINSSRKKKYEISPEEIEAISGEKVIAKIPWDENVLKGLAAKTPVIEKNPFSPASVAFYEIASALTGLDYRRPKLLQLRRLLF